MKNGRPHTITPRYVIQTLLGILVACGSVIQMVGPGVWLAELQLTFIGAYYPILSMVVLSTAVFWTLEFLNTKVGGFYNTSFLDISRFNLDLNSWGTLIGLGIAAVLGWIIFQQMAAPNLGKIEASAANAAKISNAYATVVGITDGRLVTFKDDEANQYFIPIFDPQTPKQPAKFVVHVGSNKELDWKFGKPGLVSTTGYVQPPFNKTYDFLLRRELKNNISKRYLTITPKISQSVAWKGIPFVVIIAISFPSYIRIRNWWLALKTATLSNTPPKRDILLGDVLQWFTIRDFKSEFIKQIILTILTLPPALFIFGVNLFSGNVSLAAHTILFAVIILALLLLSYSYPYYQLWKHRKERLVFHEKGIVVELSNSRASARYEDLTVWQWKELIRHEKKISLHSKILLPNGKNIFTKQNELGKELASALVKHQFYKTIYKFNRDATLSFGNLSVNKEGIQVGKRKINWFDVKQVEILKGTTLRIKKKDKLGLLAWDSVKLKSVPNSPVLIALLNQLTLLKEVM